MTAPSMAEVLAEHEEVSFNLGTPRQYTEHGGWNESCACGEPLGDGGHPTPLRDRHRAHVAQALAAAGFGHVASVDREVAAFFGKAMEHKRIAIENAQRAQAAEAQVADLRRTLDGEGGR